MCTRPGKPATWAGLGFLCSSQQESRAELELYNSVGLGAGTGQWKLIPDRIMKRKQLMHCDG